MGPLTFDLPKGLVPVAKCEKAIGGLYSVFPGNPITNAKLGKENVEAYGLQRKNWS